MMFRRPGIKERSFEFQRLDLDIRSLIGHRDHQPRNLPLVPNGQGKVLQSSDELKDLHLLVHEHPCLKKLPIHQGVRTVTHIHFHVGHHALLIRDNRFGADANSESSLVGILIFDSHEKLALVADTIRRLDPVNPTLFCRLFKGVLKHFRG